MKILETERLLLRHFEAEDIAEVYHLLFADPAVKSAWSGRKRTPDEKTGGYRLGLR